MLRMHLVTSASDAKRYYAASDYYAEGQSQETVGNWGGDLATRLGLSGTVDKQCFDRLCDNLHPVTGEALTPRTNVHRRVAYDMVFSGPKSFSIVEALAGDVERARLGHAWDAAISETMAEIEADMQTRVRKDGAWENRTTGNLVYAWFDHSTARPPEDGGPPDMHKHRHVLVFNATWDAAEGRVKAGEFANIKRDGEYYTAAFYARLAERLEAIGYRIDRSRGLKEWEIAGVSQTLVDRFSKRTGEVEEEHAERLKNDPTYRPEYKHELGAKTRGKKQKELTLEELRTAWREQLTDGERDALAKVLGGKIAQDRQISAGEAVAYALNHAFERESVVPERELKRLALLYGLGDVGIGQVEAELPRQGMIARELDGRQMATTRAVLTEERYITGFAAEGLGAVKPVDMPEGFAPGRLNDGQWKAVKGLLESANRVNVIEGAAGTGKSTLLAAYDRAMRLRGQPVTYLATTAAAVEVLRADGHHAETVALFLKSEKLQAAARGGHVVVDEASMLGHRSAYGLFHAAKANDLRLTLLGDAMQHGSIDRGATLRVLKSYGGLKPFRLDEIRRQTSHLYRDAVKALSEGRTLAGFDALDGLGYVREIREGDRYHAIGAEYLKALQERKTALVVSPTHIEGERITQEIRRQLRLTGKLGKEERAFTRLVAKNLTEAERGDARNYESGDVLQFHQNAKGFKNGERHAVEGGASASLPLQDAAKFAVYRPEHIAFAEGDAIRFTANLKTLDKKHKITNGATYTVGGFTPAGNIRLKENGWIVGAEAGHFRHGFVETSFGAQGRTVDRVIIGQATASLPATNAEQAYVSASRARERMVLFTDDKAALREAIARRSAKRAALDLVTRPAAPTFTERLRDWAARRRHRGALARARAVYQAPRPLPERQVMRYGR